jgi:hypothetical protein
MRERDWDAELKKIDKQLQSISDEALAPSPAQPCKAATAPERASERGSRWGPLARLLVALALGVAVGFWPYDSRCGAGLAYYLTAVGVTGIAGMWSAVSSWRRHWGVGHVLSLLVFAWATVLAAREVLPKTGYAVASEAHPAAWSCQPR